MKRNKIKDLEEIKDENENLKIEKTVESQKDHKRRLKSDELTTAIEEINKGYK